MKVCTKCNKRKNIGEFHLDKKAKDGVRHCCKKCANQYYKNNREKMLSYTKQYLKRNPEKVREYTRNQWRNNPERMRLNQRRSAESAKNRLSNSYVKGLLCRHSEFLQPRDIPNELVAAKREHLRLGRLLRGL